MSLWVVGGRQARDAGVADRRHEGLYDVGLVLRVDRDGSISEVHRGEALYKGASWDRGRLLLCTVDGLAWVDPGSGAVVDRWSHPWCNDVHHALVHAGRLWVASTGVDGALEHSLDARDEVRFHPALDGVSAPAGDQRGVDRAPHAAHPNHLFVHRGALYLTRFHQRDALRLHGDGPERIEVGVERPHDGVSDGEAAWFTTVDGRLVRSGPGGIAEHRLEAADGDPEPLGWCRGLHLEPGSAWVGFTRIRATRFREHLAWARGALRGQQHATRRPTRIARFPRTGGRPLETLELDGIRMDAVFAILGDPPATS